MTPVWCSFVQINQVLDQNRKVSLSHIDLDALKIYQIGNGQENRVLSALLWLGLIDDNGDVTQKLLDLRVVGNEFNKKLQEVATEAYADLIKVTPPETSTREQVINYFIKKHSFPGYKAAAAVNFLIGLWQAAGLPLSPDLAKSQERTEGGVKSVAKGKTGAKQQSKQKQIQNVSSAPEPVKNNIVILVFEGKRHEFDMTSLIDKVVFDALSKELLKNWGKRSNFEQDDADGNSPKDDKKHD